MDCQGPPSLVFLPSAFNDSALSLPFGLSPLTSQERPHNLAGALEPSVDGYFPFQSS